MASSSSSVTPGRRAAPMRSCISATTRPARRIVRISSTERRPMPRILGAAADVYDGDQAVEHQLGGAIAVDDLEQAPLPVPGDERRGLVLVLGQAPLDGGRLVVLALDHVAAAVVAHPAVLGRAGQRV